MDKRTPAQKPTSLAERFLFQLCRHYCRVSYMNKLFSALQESFASRNSTGDTAIQYVPILPPAAWPFTRRMAPYLYPHKMDCLFLFPLRILKNFITELQRTSVFALNLFSC